MADLTGHTLGKYQLQQRLGRGGMADVYQADQTTLARPVAIKILHSFLDTPEFLARFRREAQAVASLHHPHIVQVFDFETEGDTPYMVMEYLGGGTLKEKLDHLHGAGQSLSVPEVLELFRGLLDAVGYAHAQGMVHRDLKPANILYDQKQRPVLTDFGIARLIGAEKITASGVTLGTVAYMSPEQCQGASGDERTDIYALGIILYECLSGQVPFDGDTSVAVVLKHLSAPVPPLRPLRADVPPRLEQVIATALAKDPRNRYASAAEMWQALAHVPTAADDTTHPLPAKQLAPTKPMPPAARPPARLRPALLIGGVVAALILLGLGAWWLTPVFSQPSLATRALAEGQTQLAAGQYQLAADTFASVLAIDPQNTAALLGRAAAYENLGQIPEALADIEKVIQLKPDQAAAYQTRARLNLQYGLTTDFPAALADLDRAVQLDPTAQAYHVRGWAILNFPLKDNRPNSALALDDLRQAARQEPQNAEYQFTLAQALLATNLLSEALTVANRAVELAPTQLTYRQVRAHIHFVLNDLHAADDDLTFALKNEQADTELATLYSERAYVRYRLGSVSEAKADLVIAQSKDAAALLVHYGQLVFDASLPRPEPTQIQQARAAAPNDPIWQAIIQAAVAAP